MKTVKSYISIAVVLFASSANAQFLKNLGDKVVEKAGQTVERKVEEKSEKTTNDTSDKVLNPKKKSKSAESTEAATVAPTSKKSKNHPLLKAGNFTTYDIVFDYGKATMKPSSATVIDEIGALLNDNPKLKVLITVHTDSDGSDAKNLELSEERAMAIKTELVRKFELNEDNITIVGKGESEPLVKSTTEDAKKQNRRVAFKIIK